MRAGSIARVGLIAMGMHALGAGSVHADETIRCGQWVVNSSLSVAELTEKCGEPASRERKEEDVLVKTVTGGTAKAGTTIIEYWTYDRGTQAARVLVKIVDGKIRSIERIL